MAHFAKVNNGIVEQVIVADLRPKLPVLDVFTTMAQSSEDRGTTIDVPFIAGDDAITFDKASGGYAQTGDADVTKSSVNLVHYHATRAFDASELAAWGADGIINAFREEATAKIVKKVNAAVAALVTNANYSANEVITAANFDYNDVVDLDVYLDGLDAPAERGLVLNSAYIGALRKDAKLTSAFNTQGDNSVVRTGIVGRIGTLQVLQYAGLPANGENLVGFAASKDAICIGTGSVWSASPNSGIATMGGLSVMVESEYTHGILYLTAAIRMGAIREDRGVSRLAPSALLRPARRRGDRPEARDEAQVVRARELRVR